MMIRIPRQNGVITKAEKKNNYDMKKGVLTMKKNNYDMKKGVLTMFKTKRFAFSLFTGILIFSSVCFADDPAEKRGVREDDRSGFYQWERYKVPNSEFYIAGSGGMGAFGNWIEDEAGSDLTPVFQELSILCGNSGAYLINNGHDDFKILTKNFKIIDLKTADLPYCLEFDGFCVLAGSSVNSLPYNKEKSVYFDVDGSEIADIDAYLAERGTTLETAVLDSNTSKDISEPFYGTGLFKRPFTGYRYTDGSPERNGNFYYENKIYLADANGNKLSELYDEIEQITPDLYLARNRIRDKAFLPTENFLYSVLSIKNGSVHEILSERDTPFRCVDLGKEKFIFPVGGSGEYYDENGEKISDLSAMLKRNDADLGRSQWAEEAITKSLDLGFIPSDISFNYRQNITRREFCELFMRHIKDTVYYHNYEQDFADSYESPFTDIDDHYVSAANAAGIVQGVGNGKFEPEREITRQEAAVMLCKAYEYTYANSSGEPQSKFADDKEIADWAKEYVYNICTYENNEGETLMSGTGNNMFSPNAFYTREQAVATLYRMFCKDYKGLVR